MPTTFISGPVLLGFRKDVFPEEVIVVYFFLEKLSMLDHIYIDKITKPVVSAFKHMVLPSVPPKLQAV